MGVKLNGKGASHAASLISAGKVTKGDGWSAPSAAESNSYIEKNGIGEYGKWFLGIHEGTDSSTKGYYGYPFSSDFKTVNRKGIIACESRAAGQGATAIASKAKSLLNKIDGKKATATFEEICIGKQKVMIVE